MADEKEKILYTKKTITQDPNDPETQWVELDVYNFLEDQNSEDNTVHYIPPPTLFVFLHCDLFVISLKKVVN